MGSVPLRLVFTGTSGDASLWSAEKFRRVCVFLKEYISGLRERHLPRKCDITVVTFGKTFADHAVLVLFLKNLIDHVEICLPCDFSDGFDTSSTKGSSLRDLHRRFSEKLGFVSERHIISCSERETCTITKVEEPSGFEKTIFDDDCVCLITVSTGVSFPKLDSPEREIWDFATSMGVTCKNFRCS